jgi:methylenetetrahydrofolate dehydrogenase (NADP+)/methenyltetrahydrofolate cyclohydrolase
LWETNEYGWKKRVSETVTLTHSYTKNIEEITIQADIIITALGVPNYLKADG